MRRRLVSNRRGRDPASHCSCRLLAPGPPSHLAFSSPTPPPVNTCRATLPATRAAAVRRSSNHVKFSNTPATHARCKHAAHRLLPLPCGFPQLTLPPLLSKGNFFDLSSSSCQRCSSTSYSTEVRPRRACASPRTRSARTLRCKQSMSIHLHHNRRLAPRPTSVDGNNVHATHHLPHRQLCGSACHTHLGPLLSAMHPWPDLRR